MVCFHKFQDYMIDLFDDTGGGGASLTSLTVSYICYVELPILTSTASSTTYVFNCISLIFSHILQTLRNVSVSEIDRAWGNRLVGARRSPNWLLSVVPDVVQHQQQSRLQCPHWVPSEVQPPRLPPQQGAEAAA